MAEAGWTAQPLRAWPDFLARLPAEVTAEFAAIGLTEDESALALDLEASPTADGRAKVVLSSQTNYGQVRYTLDGRPPTTASSAYADPLETALPVRIRAAAFVGGRMISPALDERVDAASMRTRLSQQLTLCPGTLPLNLEGQPTAEGRRPVFLIQIMNPCWIWADVDLSAAQRIRLTLAATPDNLQLGPQTSQVIHRPSDSPTGDIEVRLDNCDTGERLAAAALASPRTEVSLELDLPARAGRALCFAHADGGRPGPIWGLEEVELAPKAAAGEIMADLAIVSPMRGWAALLDEVDDPVFAGRMLGDGVTVDPTGPELRAPCDAEVLNIHHAGHAVSLKAVNGRRNPDPCGSGNRRPRRQGVQTSRPRRRRGQARAISS